MELFILILIVVIAIAISKSKKKNDLTERVVYNGKKYVHSSFPNIPGRQRFRTYVAGSNHYNQKFPPEVDNCLLLLRDPDNSHDEHAIKVMTLLEEHVGFIPSHYSEELSLGIERGRQFYAMVDKIEPHKSNAKKEHYIISIHEIPKVEQTINHNQKVS